MPGCVSRSVSKVVLAWLIFAATPVRADTLQYAQIVQAGAVAYEAPDADSAAIRLLYVGEIVPVAEKVTANMRDWYRLRLGGDRSLYVPVAAVGPLIADPPTALKEPELVVRDQYPLGVAALAYGISHGVGAQLRYLPITRAGVTFNFGPSLDRNGVRGTSVSYGLAAYFMTGRFTPVLEVGYAFILSEAHQSRQRIQAIYVTAGIEWMFENGVFVSLLGTYFRSTRIELLFPHDAPSFVAESYPPFDAHGRSAIQRILPGGLLGYGF